MSRTFKRIQQFHARDPKPISVKGYARRLSRDFGEAITARVAPDGHGIEFVTAAGELRYSTFLHSEFTDAAQFVAGQETK